MDLGFRDRLILLYIINLYEARKVYKTRFPLAFFKKKYYTIFMLIATSKSFSIIGGFLCLKLKDFGKLL